MANGSGHSQNVDPHHCHCHLVSLHCASPHGYTIHHWVSSITAIGSVAGALSVEKIDASEQVGASLASGWNWDGAPIIIAVPQPLPLSIGLGNHLHGLIESCLHSS